MAKFKPARGKQKSSKAPPGGLPCVVLIILGVFGMMLFLYFVMRNAS